VPEKKHIRQGTLCILTKDLVEPFSSFAVLGSDKHLNQKGSSGGSYVRRKKRGARSWGATQGAVLGTPIKTAAWHSKPSWFVIASNDRAIAPEQEISTAKGMGAKTLTLASSHLPMLSHPEEVAEFVIEGAASLGASAAA
jgi:pimeloyl-ACP methyl ester carboxylesterase